MQCVIEEGAGLKMRALLLGILDKQSVAAVHVLRAHVVTVSLWMEGFMKAAATESISAACWLVSGFHWCTNHYVCVVLGSCCSLTHRQFAIMLATGCTAA